MSITNPYILLPQFQHFMEGLNIKIYPGFPLFLLEVIKTGAFGSFLFPAIPHFLAMPVYATSSGTLITTCGEDSANCR